MLVLLISDLQIKQEELSFLEKTYRDTHGHGYVPAYELVWVPIVDHVVPQSSITKPGAIKLTSDEDKISEGKLVCLYGGESIDWIRYFTKEMEKITKAASINVEMVYVGKNHPNIPVNKNIEAIKKEKLSRTWDFDTIWLFWTRLESMMHSKLQSDRSTETDQILQEMITLLTYGNSNYGWAMVSKGSLEMVKAEGKALINLLDKFDSWKDKIGTDGTKHSKVVSKITERYLLFQCCDTQDDSSGPEEDAAATAVAGLPTAAATQAATLPSTVPAQVVAASPPSVVTAQATAASPAGAAIFLSTVPAQATVVSPPSAGVVAAQATDASSRCWSICS
ncbi:SIEVE ELEMENT OCCLUSION protein [Nymphaea thermarum]|nr:SIEVE ELEMENT OCCLUSION protein [Nymphaea thermarum]